MTAGTLLQSVETKAEVDILGLGFFRQRSGDYTFDIQFDTLIESYWFIVSLRFSDVVDILEHVGEISVLNKWYDKDDRKKILLDREGKQEYFVSDYLMDLGQEDLKKVAQYVYDNQADYEHVISIQI